MPSYHPELKGPRNNPREGLDGLCPRRALGSPGVSFRTAVGPSLGEGARAGVSSLFTRWQHLVLLSLTHTQLSARVFRFYSQSLDEQEPLRVFLRFCFHSRLSPGAWPE